MSVFKDLLSNIGNLLLNIITVNYVACRDIIHMCMLQNNEHLRGTKEIIYKHCLYFLWRFTFKILN